VDRTAHLAPVAPSSANARLPSPFVCFSYRLDDAANSLHQAAVASGSSGSGSSEGAGAISSRDRARCLLTVEMHAPVAISNKLPCSLDYCLGTSQVPLSTVPAIGQGVASGNLLPGGEARVCRAAHWRDPSLGLALKLGKYHWKGLALGGDDLKVLLEQGRKGVASVLEMEDGYAPGLSDATQQANKSGSAAASDGYGGVNSDGSSSPPGRTFAVSVLVTEPSQGRILVEVFARHWVIDRSGLGLTCGGRKNMIGFQAKQPGSVPCGNGVSALQTLTEEARSKDNKGNKNARAASAAGGEAGTSDTPYEEGWALGEGGLSLLRSSKDHLVVALPTNTPFARPSLDPRSARSQRSEPACSSVLAIGITTAKADNVFSIECGERSVELCYEVTQGVGAFENSKVVRICPRFAILNPDARATLLVRQEGTSPDDGAHVVAVPPRGKAFYHWSNAKAPKRLLVKFLDPESNEEDSLSTAWSFGGVNIEAIGATPLWLPPSDTLAPSPGAPIALDAHTLTVVQVEVQLADDHQDSASNVLIERLPKNQSAAARFGPSSSLAVQGGVGKSDNTARAVPVLAVQNDTREPLVLRQGAAPSSTRTVPGVPLVRWVLKPGESMVFGWLAPASLPKEVWATVQAVSDRSSSSSGASLTDAVARVLPSSSSFSGSDSGANATDDDGGIEFEDDEDEDDSQGTVSPLASSPSAGGGGGAVVKKSNSGVFQSMGKEITTKVSKVGGGGGGGKMKKTEHCFKMLEMAGAGAKPKRLIAPDSGALVSAAAVVPVRGTRLLLFAPAGKVLQAFRAERSSGRKSDRSVSLEVVLPQGVGLSVVDDYGDSALGLDGSGLPAMRREILYLVANGVSFTATHDTDAQQSDLALQV